MLLLYYKRFDVSSSQFNFILIPQTLKFVVEKYPKFMTEFDICVVGHLTKDTIRIEGEVVRELVGGTAYYSSLALHTLGLNVAVVTKTAPEDRDRLLADLEARNIPVFWQPSEKTSIFEDIYPTKNLDRRFEKVWAVASPFSVADLGDVRAKMIHLGPLTDRDIDVDFLAAIADRGEVIALDAQGLTRRVMSDGEVEAISWQDAKKGLSSIDILKLDEKEAKILTKTDNLVSASQILSEMGVKEVIITFGSQGSQIYYCNNLVNIPSLPPKRIVDATGCGDTYIAGYLYQRFLGKDIETSGRFAAMVASLKIENFGALLELGNFLS
jgi:sugar/nucleoside kinase (ribokinase family)